jgi:hypothetical protein
MRSDWTQNAITFAKGIKTAKVQGKRWQAAGKLLRTLKAAISRSQAKYHLRTGVFCF